MTKKLTANTKLTIALTVVFFAIMGVMCCFAAPGVDGLWRWLQNQLKTLIVIVALALGVMSFAQKQTVKGIITIVAGALLYVIVGAGPDFFQSIGNTLKGWFGL